MSEAMKLVRRVMQGAIAGHRIVDSTVVVQIVAGDEPVDGSAVATFGEAGFQPSPTAAIHRQGQTRAGEPGLGLYVDYTRRIDPVLCRKRPGQHRDGIGEPRFQRLAKERESFREFAPRRCDIARWPSRPGCGSGRNCPARRPATVARPGSCPRLNPAGSPAALAGQIDTSSRRDLAGSAGGPHPIVSM